MRARAIFAVGMLLGACRGPSAPSATGAGAGAVEVAPIGSGASSGVVATDDAAVDDSMAPPEEHPSGDPACTAVATRGRHLIGTQQGCVKCPGADNGDFVEMRSGEYGKIDRDDLIRKKCATRADIGAETCTAIFDAIGYDIVGRAHAAGLRINGVGIMQCAAGAGYYVTTDDPQMGITLQKITRDVMKEWKIRGTIYVRVAPIPRAVPL